MRKVLLVLFSFILLAAAAYAADAWTCRSCSGSGSCYHCSGRGVDYYGDKCGQCDGKGKCYHCGGKGTL